MPGTTTFNVWLTNTTLGVRTQIVSFSGPSSAMRNGGTYSAIYYDHYANMNGDSGQPGGLVAASGRALGQEVVVAGPPTGCGELNYTP